MNFQLARFRATSGVIVHLYVVLGLNWHKELEILVLSPGVTDDFSLLNNFQVHVRLLSFEFSREIKAFDWSLGSNSL